MMNGIDDDAAEMAMYGTWNGQGTCFSKGSDIECIFQ